jgi:hypothetical protein
MGNPTQNIYVSRLSASAVNENGALLLGNADRGRTTQVMNM